MYDKDLLLTVLLRDDCRPLDHCGNPFIPSHSVYLKIADIMKSKNNHITPKHVYCILKENRNGFKNILQEKLNISSNISGKNEISFASNDSINNFNSNVDGFYSKNIQVVVSSVDYETIKPVEKMYGNRHYWKFKNGWTDVIANKVY